MQEREMLKNSRKLKQVLPLKMQSCLNISQTKDLMCSEKLTCHLTLFSLALVGMKTLNQREDITEDITQMNLKTSRKSCLFLLPSTSTILRKVKAEVHQKDSLVLELKKKTNQDLFRLSKLLEDSRVLSQCSLNKIKKLMLKERMSLFTT